LEFQREFTLTSADVENIVERLNTHGIWLVTDDARERAQLEWDDPDGDMIFVSGEAVDKALRGDTDGE
jgi:hypothetical protein